MTNRTYKFKECRFESKVVRTTLNKRLEDNDYEITLMFDKNGKGEYVKAYVCDEESGYSVASFKITSFDYNEERGEAIVETPEGIQVIFTLYREWETEDGYIDISKIYCLS